MTTGEEPFSAMTFTVMITTHDRCTDLRRTCAALTALAPPPDEVLICADGCTDDTVPMVRREFPGFVVLENPERQGSVASRDRMLRLASADIVISLDDDSYPVQPDFLARLSQVLEAHPEAAVVSFAEIRDDDRADLLRFLEMTAAVATSRPMPIAAPPCVGTSISSSPAFRGSSATCTRSPTTPCNATRRALRSGSSRTWPCVITCRGSIATRAAVSVCTPGTSSGAC